MIDTDRIMGGNKVLSYCHLLPHRYVLIYDASTYDIYKTQGNAESCCMASARVIIVCFFIASLFLILFLNAKVRQKSHTELYFLFKYHSFSAFFCNFAAANKIGIYK